MNINLKPGKYVLAVSGGVDSMVLLDLLRGRAGVRLVVAHFDHGIRPDSAQDRQLVQRVAMSHNLAFEFAEGHLGAGTSEEVAREARYKFLRQVCNKHNATAIITAHHQDDLLETAVINMLRGTGWRGLSSLRSRPGHELRAYSFGHRPVVRGRYENRAGLIRPLLGYGKRDIVEYARQHRLEWREDSTNQDDSYLRNYVRHNILPRMSHAQQQKLLDIIVRHNDLTEQIDTEINDWLDKYAHDDALGGTVLPRYQLIMLPQNVAQEAVQQVLRRSSGNSLQRPLAEAALLFCKVAKSGKVMQLNAHWQIRAMAKDVIVEPRGDVVS